MNGICSTIGQYVYKLQALNSVVIYMSKKSIVFFVPQTVHIKNNLQIMNQLQRYFLDVFEVCQCDARNDIDMTKILPHYKKRH